jgi:hypothetical protein
MSGIIPLNSYKHEREREREEEEEEEEKGARKFFVLKVTRQYRFLLLAAVHFRKRKHLQSEKLTG